MMKQLKMLQVNLDEQMNIRDFSKIAINRKVLPPEMQSDFESNVLKFVYNINSDCRKIEDIDLSADVFISYLNSYLTQI